MILIGQAMKYAVLDNARACRSRSCGQWPIDDAKSERHKLELWLQFMVLHWEDLGIF